MATHAERSVMQVWCYLIDVGLAQEYVHNHWNMGNPGRLPLALDDEEYADRRRCRRMAHRLLGRFESKPWIQNRRKRTTGRSKEASLLFCHSNK
jgi:glutathione S-transferase